MDVGNDVDLSNNNITPLWKPHSSKLPQNLNKTRQRPISYHHNGVTTSDFHLENVDCSFTPNQPAESLNRVTLTHVLQKPSKKSRIVRSLSSGRRTKKHVPMSKVRTEDNRRTSNGDNGVEKAKNGQAVWFERRLQDNQRSPIKDDTDSASMSPQTPENHQDLFSSSPSPLSHLPLTPSHSSTSSIPSLLSLNSSDPPTPRSSSPTDRAQTPIRQSPMSLSPSCSTKQSSTSSSISPSPSPSASPATPVVLSTHSPAALKMGTQQLIPKGLASESRHSKPPGTQGQGLAGLLGVDHSKRSVKALSMVETGPYFSTGSGHGEHADEDNDSPGALRRGLRSTSYRKAVVSSVDMDDSMLMKPIQSLTLSPVQSAQSPTIPSSPDSVKTLSPGTPKSLSPRTLKPSSPGMENQKSGGMVKSPDKKKVLVSQPTFDSEEEELYQNYKEKALHNDSDEDADAREIKPDDGIVVQYRPLRTTWSQLTVVKKSGLSDKVSQEERKRQEAIFELISSEHSYFHSLEILIRLFKDSAELRETMTKMQHHHLFSNISDVCEASKKFFKELEERHEMNIVIDDISDIVCKHAESNFDPFITYCSNEVYQQRTLQKLVSTNPVFKEVLTKIEAHPDCRNLPMISFLILPMQRITRLPLLLDTICQKTPKNSKQYEDCKTALQEISKVVRKCNEGARTMERTEMLCTINSQLEFKIKPFPLISSSRWMVKRGELTSLVEGAFLKRTSRQHVYLFLFNDVLIITRKKSEDSYSVVDYALRDEISVSLYQPDDLKPMLSPRPSSNHLFHLCFERNHSGERIQRILGTESLNERARWISVLGQNPNNKKDQDKSNAIQVEVIRTYTARQPDELSLQVADVVLVSQTVDGWHEGERLRDGERGWFLAECAVQITCPATIERNMQRMNRLQGLETNV
ncbi:rho guanine nucleotide exchange factor 26 [Oryzias melastigma]|uniref:Rho guanine nucleotide exchange factor 26 n=1 Tax=Oryzias melastigma TaxID=30732 RepID=A0A3B3DDJ4_ORYME|nr:rho guanine nucleotide exchange factor 26 [Oryzias melastigma]XP_036070623.1 rho guanine nucleotide exchange factor 26 [Oryzias melastigma]